MNGAFHFTPLIKYKKGQYLCYVQVISSNPAVEIIIDFSHFCLKYGYIKYRTRKERKTIHKTKERHWQKLIIKAKDIFKLAITDEPMLLADFQMEFSIL